MSASESAINLQCTVGANGAQTYMLCNVLDSKNTAPTVPSVPRQPDKRSPGSLGRLDSGVGGAAPALGMSAGCAAEQVVLKQKTDLYSTDCDGRLGTLTPVLECFSLKLAIRDIKARCPQ
jgi:hypothetical protein